jgi:hypothetical protein
MAITSTTLSGAITASQTSFAVASATGITAPNFQTGAGITLIQIDQEQMLVTAINGTFVSVVRGYNGTAGAAHVSGALVQAGLLTDFAQLQENLSPLQAQLAIIAGYKQPAIFLTGLADAIDPTKAGFYVIKSAAADLMTLLAPTAKEEGNIIEIWSDAAFAHTLTATSLLAGGTALKTTGTFPAFRGAGIKLRACNLVWHVLSSGNGNVSSFVVLT